MYSLDAALRQSASIIWYSLIVRLGGRNVCQRAQQVAISATKARFLRRRKLCALTLKIDALAPIAQGVTLGRISSQTYTSALAALPADLSSYVA